MTQLKVASLGSPAPGESECGDWVGSLTVASAGVVWLLVIDGLGHGPHAAKAAHAARDHLQLALEEPGWVGRPAAALADLEPALRETRGAAVGLACVHGGELVHAGIGNTRCRLWRGGQMRGLHSVYGIAGAFGSHTAGANPRVTETRLELRAGDWVLMFSDGLAENMRLDAVPGEWAHEPSRLCRDLMQRWRVARDDAAVLAACVLQA